MDDSEQGIENDHLFDAGSTQPSSRTPTQGGRQRTTTHRTRIINNVKKKTSKDVESCAT